MNTTLFNEYPDIMTVEEVCKALRIGYNKAYDFLKDGTIKSIKSGRKYLIPKISVQEYVLKNI